MNFINKLQAKWNEGKFVCVGLDPDIEKIPHVVKSSQNSSEEIIFTFNREIIDATHTLAATYKPNSAFYEAEGEQGLRALKRTIEYIKNEYQIPVILDAKRGDIGNTNNGYVKFAFDVLQADAITVQPYLGKVAMQSFLDQREKGIFVLVRTSNEGAGEFQDLEIDGTPLYQVVGTTVVRDWNENGNVGLVMGATAPSEIATVREKFAEIPLLIPGVGAQGGDLENTVRAAKRNFIINSSRGILYASSGEDFAEVARAECQKLTNLIRSLVN